MDFNYITINGLDEDTRLRMERDVSKSGYKGSKTAYVSGLIRDGLDKHESLRNIPSEEELHSLEESLSSINETVSEILKRGCQGDGKGEIDRLLLIEIYRMLEALMDATGIDCTDVKEGKLDSLPTHLCYKEDALRRAYGNALRAREAPLLRAE